MPPVFAHGRLRLYLLKLLDEAPRHGYEVIRLLEERFQGLYAPSAGTVYPRLAKLEAEGLVTHTTEGGRKVYAITDAGRAELAGRSGELADLEQEIRESVAELAAEIRADVSGAAGDLRREMRAAAGRARQSRGTGASTDDEGLPGDFTVFGDKDAWRAAREEMRRAKQEWKEQARRAKDESRRSREEAQRARRQAQEAQEQVQRIMRQVQEQTQDHFARGDWPTGLREGLSELAKGMGEFGKDFTFGRTGTGPAGKASEPSYSQTPADFPAGCTPAWAHEDASDSTGDPTRDLDRLLDRFRDDIRDAARDHGVTGDQLRDARRHLSTAAANIGAVLRTPKP
ncbi:PadR family transcriptional regulator [Streptomyces toyocaensis]|uniref:PadR family transcriptional regulator n=1 Tax=Streptomyces toyocaensis TaxID=55952 RepID=A0A081XLV9_STRTO|nr:PadR family transcriptional regulator [Streptomyces toyocaensis]KES04532.1 PadR family transcriptional regulator [Streptomyces toyocaensis]